MVGAFRCRFLAALKRIHANGILNKPVFDYNIIKLDGGITFLH